MTREQAQAAVEGIISDLSDRGGLKQGWDETDEDIREQIKLQWTGIIIQEANSRNPNDIITAEDRELLAQAYLESEYLGGPYPTYAELARNGNSAFTLCSLRAIARARLAAGNQTPADA